MQRHRSVQALDVVLTRVNPPLMPPATPLRATLDAKLGRLKNLGKPEDVLNAVVQDPIELLEGRRFAE